MIRGLDDVWTRLDALLAGLQPDDWSRPTPNPGWDVRDTVAHIIGTEAMVLGEHVGVEIDRAAHPHVRNDIGAFNEAWVEALRATAPSDVLARFRDVVERRRAALADTDLATWNAEGFTPVGPDSYGRFMRIRVFDCWMHELDIRDATHRPDGAEGPAAVLALDEMTVSMPYVVGKKAGAPGGSSVRFELTGRAARTIDVAVGERAALVERLEGEPTLTLTMPAGVFVRLGGGRVDVRAVRDRIEIDGDDALGERILESMAFTI